jgi:hypothetical protein
MLNPGSWKNYNLHIYPSTSGSWMKVILYKLPGTRKWKEKSLSSLMHSTLSLINKTSPSRLLPNCQQLHWGETGSARVVELAGKCVEGSSGENHFRALACIRNTVDDALTSVPVTAWVTINKIEPGYERTLGTQAHQITRIGWLCYHISTLMKMFGWIELESGVLGLRMR